MRWMALILLVVAIGGGVGWGIATVTTTGDPSLDYARRLDRTASSEASPHWATASSHA